MSTRIRPVFAPPSRNLSALFLRDVASLLATSHLVSRSVVTLRPQCAFSRKLTATLDSLGATSAAGELLLNPPLAESAATPPGPSDTSESALLTDFLVRLPAQVTPGVPAAKLALTLRLLTRHIELKARLAAEAALCVGQQALSQALMGWAAQWRACSAALCLAKECTPTLTAG